MSLRHSPNARVAASGATFAIYKQIEYFSVCECTRSVISTREC